MFRFVFICVQTESSDEDEASGDEGLPDDDSDVSPFNPNYPQDRLVFFLKEVKTFTFWSLLELGRGGSDGRRPR